MKQLNSELRKALGSKSFEQLSGTFKPFCENSQDVVPEIQKFLRLNIYRRLQSSGWSSEHYPEREVLITETQSTFFVQWCDIDDGYRPRNGSEIHSDPTNFIVNEHIWIRAIIDSTNRLNTDEIMDRVVFMHSGHRKDNPLCEDEIRSHMENVQHERLPEFLLRANSEQVYRSGCDFMLFVGFNEDTTIPEVDWSFLDEYIEGHPTACIVDLVPHGVLLALWSESAREHCKSRSESVFGSDDMEADSELDSDVLLSLWGDNGPPEFSE